MAQRGGATIQLTKASEQNFKRQMKRIGDRSSEAAVAGFEKFLQNAVTLAKNKLKADKHIQTSRLRNSIGVMTAKKNIGKYSDGMGGTFDGDIRANLKDDEAAIGTNVEYAGFIEFQHDSFLYWAIKNSNRAEMGRAISERLLGFKQ